MLSFEDWDSGYHLFQIALSFFFNDFKSYFGVLVRQRLRSHVCSDAAPQEQCKKNSPNRIYLHW